jgi:peptide/nickel transport system permease protein
MTGGQGFVRRLIRRPPAVLALIWLAIVVICSLYPRAVTSRSPVEQDLSASLEGPSTAHPFGTDRLGQDVLSRIVDGGANTLWGVLVAVVVSVVLGVSLGLIAGYLGGAVDALAMRISDMLFAVPAIIILLVVVAVFPNNITIAMVTFGVLLASGLIRVVRSATRSLREELFIAAAKVSGLSGLQILRRHILPRLASLITVQTSLIASITLITQAGLAFLGFGPPPPQSSWGAMINEARANMTEQPWSLVPPGLAVALTVLAFSMLGDAVRDTTTQSWSTSKLISSRSRRQVVSVASSRPAARPNSLLSVARLSVAIPSPSGRRSSATTVVSDVSFDIVEGEVLGLVGESGCGKTVTALSILGLVPGAGWISAGSCDFAGQDLTQASASQWSAVRGRGIGYIAQDPMASLDPTFRAGSQLAEAVRRHTGCGRSEARNRAVELLRSVGLPDPARVARQYPHQMSGGMAQRVAIAFALAGSPRLLIADEPTTALDVTVQAEALALLRRLSRERQMAVLIVTHDLGVVAELCDRVLVMYAGQIVEACTAMELFDEPRHPYTIGLLASDPHRATSRGPVPTIAGTVPAPADWPHGCRFADRCAFVLPQCRVAPIEAIELTPARVSRCVRAEELATVAVTA